jgi:hypothetical protein
MKTRNLIGMLAMVAATAIPAIGASQGYARPRTNGGVIVRRNPFNTQSQIPRPSGYRRQNNRPIQIGTTTIRFGNRRGRVYNAYPNYGYPYGYNYPSYPYGFSSYGYGFPTGGTYYWGGF